ncbi:DUF2294 domain-containing protein [Paenibacillus sp. Y412MC10]|uniref:DUF2294 domain-containing protein n=1 Tax=Geobacillus sp. (strain Y412MC10) TaxID=481743 RepID=UPI00119FF5A4|nr:Na-translocating system protein MpsC family protein [Paenibacillus sp. Y412MC10]
MDQLHNQQPFHQLFASYTSKLLRDHFGKGPESVVVSVGHTFITIYLRNFLTPSERILLEQEQEDMIVQTRANLMQAVIPEIISYLEIMNGSKPEEVYYDWNLHKRSGMIAVVSAEAGKQGTAVNREYPVKSEVEAEILHICQQIQKSPEQIDSFELNPRTLLVVRSGVYLELEKALIRLGHGRLLKSVKSGLEKEYIMRSKRLNSLLHQPVSDCFIDWNDKLDKSILLLIMNPPR